MKDSVAAKPSLRHRFYPESLFGGFSHADMSISFYIRIAALLRPSDRVLDFGAGRGAQIEEDTIPFRRSLKILKGRVARVDGCDLDPEVLKNPYLDEGRLIDSPSAPLPYEDATFDLIFCSWVFEHIEYAQATSRELLRILKPGGYICAMTPNKWGYVAIASRVAGNKRHVALLKRIQPDRKEFDVFPTFYRMNSESELVKSFGPEATVRCYQTSGEPAYHFDSPTIFRIMKLAHKLMPTFLQSTLFVFVQKKSYALTP